MRNLTSAFCNMSAILRYQKWSNEELFPGQTGALKVLTLGCSIIFSMFPLGGSIVSFDVDIS